MIKHTILRIISFCMFFGTCQFVAAQENQSRKDSDSDGLTDELEILIGTQIDNKDSDGDGSVDKLEIRFGTDPTNANERVLSMESAKNLEELKVELARGQKAKITRGGKIEEVTKGNGTISDSHPYIQQLKAQNIERAKVNAQRANAEKERKDRETKAQRSRDEAALTIMQDNCDKLHKLSIEQGTTKSRMDWQIAHSKMLDLQWRLFPETIPATPDSPLEKLADKIDGLEKEIKNR